MIRTTWPFEALARAGRHRAVWLAAPLLLYLWTVPGSFLFDDYHLLLKAEAYARGERPRLCLFEFADTEAHWRELINHGTLPWWVPKNLRITFLRPLAEWSFYLDVRLFGRYAFAHRLVSLAWFAMALVAVRRLYLTLGADETRAGVATFLLGVSQAASGPVAFVCNRADLMVLVGAALAAQAVYTRRSAAWAVLLGAAGFLLAILSKETAVPLAVVLLINQIVHRVRPASGPAVRPRAAVVAVVVAIAAIYLAYYGMNHSARWSAAASSSGIRGLVGTLPRTLGLYLSVWTVGLPLHALWYGAPPLASTVLSAFGFVGAAVALFYAWRTQQQQAGVRFFVIWAAMFIVPALLTVAEPRAIFLATVGWAFLLAGIVLPAKPAEAGAPGVVRHWLLTVNGLVSVCCVLVATAIASSSDAAAMRRIREHVATVMPPLQSGDALIVAEAADMVDIPFAADRLEYETGLKDVSIVFLTVPGTAPKCVVEGPQEFRLESASRLLFGSALHELAFDPRWQPKVGVEFSTSLFSAEIAAVSPEGYATVLRFRFDEPLNSPRLRFLPAEFAAAVHGRPGESGASDAAAP